MHHRTWPPLEASLLALGIFCSPGSCPCWCAQPVPSLSNLFLANPLSWRAYFGGTHVEEAGVSGSERLFCGVVFVKAGHFYR